MYFLWIGIGASFLYILRMQGAAMERFTDGPQLDVTARVPRDFCWCRNEHSGAGAESPCGAVWETGGCC